MLVCSEHQSTKKDVTWYRGWTASIPTRKIEEIAKQDGDFITSVSSFGAVSPQGARFVMAVGKGQLDLCPFDGSKSHRLKIPKGSPFHPAWSADGRKLVFELGRNGPGTCIFDVEEDKAEVVGEKIEFPAFTLSGNSIFGLGDSKDPRQSDLIRLDLSTAKVSRLVLDVGYEPPAPSPDGKRIAIARWRTEEIVIVGLDGKDETAVAKGESPAWSPDGTRLAYERADRIFVLDLKSGVERELGEGSHPSWSR